MEIIVILIIVIVVVIVISSSAASTQLSEKDEAAINEAINYIGVVKNLFTGDALLTKGETLGCFQIIPIDETKDLYSPNSCKLMLLLLLYDDDEWRIQSIYAAAERNSSAFAACFHPEIVADDKHFVAYSVCRFSSKYKSFMKNLYSEVDSHYPGKFQFDGSRIMSCDQYGKSIF